ncbi:MAG: 4-hydroxythreonine-4-phosphate dehydrogenase PdxA [Nitrospirae bacterium]|nr:4-hydroxythreonine-4-phosphate dehydrogenase PdxA [Nitrospirota bacterium]
MKKFAITMGDPGGVGPEIIVKALNSFLDKEFNSSIVVVGDSIFLEESMQFLKRPLNFEIFKSSERPDLNSDSKTVKLIDVGVIKKFKKSALGKPTVEGGKASVFYIKKAVELALKRMVDGIITAPISKKSWKMAGFKWPGHTEMLVELTRTKEYAMMLVSDSIKIILVTIHSPLKKVPSLIKKDRILRTIRLSKKASYMLGIEKPKIAVAGLNPHAGEEGLFGDEEIKEIIPSVKKAQKEGIPVSGPYPPDSLFHKAYNGEFDIVVCMYHDQGLIPLKMVSFDRGVNVTVGLPFVRTSPDHGTAYDIAWKGIADPSSMIEAIKLASIIKVHN